MWWRFEAPEIAREPWMPIANSGANAPHVPTDQLGYLRRHNLLTPAEQSALVPLHSDFDRLGACRSLSLSRDCRPVKTTVQGY